MAAKPKKPKKPAVDPHKALQIAVEQARAAGPAGRPVSGSGQKR